MARHLKTGLKREEKGSIKRRWGEGENRPCYSNEFEAMKVRASVWPVVLLLSCEYRSWKLRACFVTPRWNTMISFSVTTGHPLCSLSLPRRNIKEDPTEVTFSEQSRDPWAKRHLLLWIHSASHQFLWHSIWNHLRKYLSFRNERATD